MAWDRHTVFDAWNKLFGGQGSNPNDAFGKLRAAKPAENYGLFVGGYHGYEDPDSPYIYAYTTTGIFWYRKATEEVGFARSEGELPLS